MIGNIKGHRQGNQPQARRHCRSRCRSGHRGGGDNVAYSGDSDAYIAGQAAVDTWGN